LKQIKLTENRRPTVRHSGGGGHSLEILPRAPEIIDPPLLIVDLKLVHSASRVKDRIDHERCKVKGFKKKTLKGSKTF